MDGVAALPAAERNALFSETAARMGTTPAVIEKDFWVTWVLSRLFEDPTLARLLLFKGGTSLSKVYQVIERFSEDIDLILDWRELTGGDPRADRSRSAQARVVSDITTEALAYIGRDLMPRIVGALSPFCTCALSRDDGHVIDIRYPGAFPDTYLRPEVRLEIGPLAAWMPHEERAISSYAAEHFPRLFKRAQATVRVIRAERTFWEKATILHHEAYRPAGNPQPLRYSRHYYDLARMAVSPIKAAALADLQLLAEVVDFKDRFYPRGWARYDLARPGSLRLVPDGEVLRAVTNDYVAMANMIFGATLTFDEILGVLAKLEAEINEGA
ncbi:MAG: nucleotidyl transferase AbiEii/AbiGii toxin family protein [Proteobacteria bacterium]|nr:nucleotidyl transferase AbiEii/AbiGii toxin family protein [Pseudomonadota bacterium]